MMMIIIVIHVIACIGLIGLVLIQRGRGGGLVESFSGVESMFGTKTSAFLTRATTVLSIVFFITCLSLAFFSIRQSRSLMENAPAALPNTAALAPEPPKAEEKAQAVPPAQTTAPAPKPESAPKTE